MGGIIKQVIVDGGFTCYYRRNYFVRYFMSENKFKSKWECLDSNIKPSVVFRNLVVMDFAEFREKVYANEQKYVDQLTESLYAGDVYILKRAFPPEFLINLKIKAHELGEKKNEDYQPMIDGVPDQHRIIDAEVSKNYTYTANRHSYFFFPWNGDPLNMFAEVNERWRVFKYLGGFPKNMYEKNLPHDGVIDRIQLAQYPAGGGGLEPHQDPILNQKVIIGGIMSKRGVNYQTGGIFFMNNKKERVEVEDHLDIGDMFCSYPTIVHGVNPVDQHVPLNWKSIEGRWFLGLYSNDSNYKTNRVSVTRITEDQLK